ncbi:tetratricopeptide repeat protein [Micromonospora chaiyaphumensis]|uniref:Transcriptional regulator, contains XRE-family HTH domain n=1 Tax=Micromonospora chaiyaphumensis TaxID=307119 RepID=A0A1C4WCK4_9ACTN|nr:helix-turn-helix domain-containing protein [Micromonospora chaiyaphumensis]SCE93966.1 Transcriptional regulator, contains XRE-family HTH domain [Micromonospora chaiyaphumensis]
MFGSMLRAHRARALLTQEELAARAGVSVRHLREIESGRVQSPRGSTVRALADALGLSEPDRERWQRAARDMAGELPDPVDPGLRRAEGAGQGAPPPADAEHVDVRQGASGTPEPHRLDHLRAAPAPWRPVPALLPPDAYGFTGRTEPLARLDAVLATVAVEQPTAVPICLVSGAPGVGKTTLAVHWAHRNRHRFPDGQLYIDLHGFTPGQPAVEPAHAIRRLLDALGVPPGRIPADSGAQLDLYRMTLAERRLLVLLDNARDVAQVRPLLPGSPTSMVIVTSRDQLTGLVVGNGAHPVGLGTFSDEESHEFLRRRLNDGRVEAQPQAIAHIAQRCARLPLALAIVVGRAVQQPSFPLSAFASQLADDRSRLDLLAADEADTNLRAVFADSYLGLDSASARLFCLLGAWPAPDISVAATASLAGLPPDRVRPLLARLVRAHLVVERAEGRYLLHDLLAAYAAELVHEQLDEAERVEAVHRALDHFLHTAAAAAAVLRPQRQPLPLSVARPGAVVESITTIGDAFAWFASELPTLMTAVSIAGGAGFDRHVTLLAQAMQTYLYRQGLHHEQARVQQAALAATQRLGDRPAQARAHLSVAHALTSAGRHDDALRHFNRALTLYVEVEDREGQAQTHRHIAWLHEARDHHRESLHHAEQALVLSAAAGDDLGVAEALNLVGWYHATLDDTVAAQIYCRRALALHRRLHNPAGEANASDSLGYALVRAKLHRRGIWHYQRALRLFRAVGARLDQAEVLDHLGDAHAAVGETANARRSWSESVAILETVDAARAAAVRDKLDFRAGSGDATSGDS